MIQGGLQVQLGPGSQTGPQPIKEVDESLKLHIHQVPKRITQTEGLKVSDSTCSFTQKLNYDFSCSIKLV